MQTGACWTPESMLLLGWLCNSLWAAVVTIGCRGENTSETLAHQIPELKKMFQATNFPRVVRKTSVLLSPVCSHLLPGGHPPKRKVSGLPAGSWPISWGNPGATVANSEMRIWIWPLWHCQPLLAAWSSAVTPGLV